MYALFICFLEVEREVRQFTLIAADLEKLPLGVLAGPRSYPQIRRGVRHGAALPAPAGRE